MWVSNTAHDKHLSQDHGRLLTHTGLRSVYRHALPPEWCTLLVSKHLCFGSSRQKDTKNTVGYRQGSALVSASVLRTAHPVPQGSKIKPTLHMRVAWEQVDRARASAVRGGQAPRVKKQCGDVAFSVRVCDHHLHLSRHSLSEELVA